MGKERTKGWRSTVTARWSGIDPEETPPPHLVSPAPHSPGRDSHFIATCLLPSSPARAQALGSGLPLASRPNTLNESRKHGSENPRTRRSLIFRQSGAPPRLVASTAKGLDLRSTVHTIPLKSCANASSACAWTGVLCALH